MFNVSRDTRVVEVNLCQLRQRLEVFNVSRDARVVELKPDQVQKRLQAFNVSRDVRVFEVIAMAPPIIAINFELDDWVLSFLFCDGSNNRS